MRRNNTGKLIAGSVALILIILAVAGVSRFLDRRESSGQEAGKEEDEERTDQQWNLSNTVYLDGETYGFDHRIESFLFMGTDASGNESGEGEDYRGTMADFLLLMVLDYTDDSYGCLQIDRNTITEVAELDKEGNISNLRDLQICVSHWYGWDPEMSAGNVVSSVKVLLGELNQIDGYYQISMEDIDVLNNAVGGVEVTIDDDLTAADPAFTKGSTIRLDDQQAERFVRSRMSLANATNKARMGRQKQYMSGLFQSAREKTRQNPGFGMKLWEVMRNAKVSNMNGNDFSRICQMLLKGQDKGILTISGKTKVGRVLDDGEEHEEFYPDPSSIRDVMTQLYSLVKIEEPEESEE